MRITVHIYGRGRESLTKLGWHFRQVPRLIILASDKVTWGHPPQITKIEQAFKNVHRLSLSRPRAENNGRGKRRLAEVAVVPRHRRVSLPCRHRPHNPARFGAPRGYLLRTGEALTVVSANKTRGAGCGLVSFNRIRCRIRVVTGVQHCTAVTRTK